MRWNRSMTISCALLSDNVIGVWSTINDRSSMPASSLRPSLGRRPPVFGPPKAARVVERTERSFWARSAVQSSCA